MKEDRKEITIRIDLSKYPELRGIDLKDLFNPFRQFGKLLQESFQLMNKQLSEVFKIVAENYSKVPEATKKALVLLAEKGWYLPSMDFSMDLHFELAVELLNGSEDKVNNKLCELIKNDFEKLSEEIFFLYPHRSRIIKAACKVHNNNEYSLSIPIFLAQADGICKEKIGHDLFKKINGNPATARYVEKFNQDSFMSSLLEPFRVALPISASENQRKNKNISLNRHQILHGEVYDYDTELNSYKSFSFLSYVCTVLDMAEKK